MDIFIVRKYPLINTLLQILKKQMQRMLDETKEIYSAEREEKYGALGIRCELL